MFRPIALAAALLAAPHAPAPTGNLNATLAKLDAASARFKSAEATFHKLDHSKLTGDETYDGQVYFLRSGGTLEAGIKIAGKNGRIATYRNGMLRDYNPGQANCYNQIDSSKNKGKAESFLTLGFGGSGHDLAGAWTITDDGPEDVAGVKAEKLELVSKDAGVRQNFSKVILWMDLDRDVSVKQQFIVAGTEDVNTATYSNIRLNTKVDTKPFEYKAEACK